MSGVQRGRLVVLVCATVAACVFGTSASSGQPRASQSQGAEAKLVAYTTSSGSAWVLDMQTKAKRRLGSGSAVEVSPSGSYIAVGDTTQPGATLSLYPFSGQTPSAFTLGSGTATPLAWSRDSRYLAVAVSGNGSASTGARLVVIDMETMTTTAIARGVVSGASFRPATSDTLVFALARSESYRASVNLYTAAPDGTAKRALTTDGRSLNPQWGAEGIAFDRERFVNLGTGRAPIADIWLRTNSGRLRRLTDLTIQQHGEGLIFGLVPIEFDVAGTRLLTALEGQDTDSAWTIDLTNRRLHKITPNRTPGVVEPSAISGDGRSLLVTEGDYIGPHHIVDEISFDGGHATRLAAGRASSWNL
jgi:hypothetical protein